MRARVAGALFAPAVLLAAACNSGGSSHSSGSTSSSPTAVASAPTGGATGGGTSTNLKQLSQSDLQKAALTVADLPGTGWQDDGTNGGNGGPPDTGSTACNTLLQADVGKGATKVEQDVSRNDATSYTFVLIEYPSADAATSTLSAIKAAQPGCSHVTVSQGGVTATMQFSTESAPHLGDDATAMSQKAQSSDGTMSSGMIVIVREGQTFVITETQNEDLSVPMPDPAVVSKAVTKYTQAAS